MKYGTVIYYNLNNGQGCIAPDGATDDVIVNQSEVDRAGLGQIAARQKLGFEIANTLSGPEAVNLWATFDNR